MSAAGTATTGDALLIETAARLLAQTATFDRVEQAEANRWSPEIWDAMAAAGFPWISVPEEAGGSGGSLADALAVVRAVGRHAAPVPVAETSLLGGWLAASAGFELPDGPLTVVPDPAAVTIDGDRVRGGAVVAWAERADRILALAGSEIVSVRPDQVVITPGANMAGEPRDTVRFDVPLGEVERASAPGGVDGDALRMRGVLTRVVLAAGALETMSRLAVDYAHARHQFGRPIAGFQAVQHHLVTTAQCAVRASMAADVAGRAVAAGDGRFEVAAARVVVDAATVEATRAAHQVHGAMGVTREYPLHHYSRRLWAWRHEYGQTRAWRRALGHDLAAAGADALFPTISR
jgi:acyl-CoA dehydrogenase